MYLYQACSPRGQDTAGWSHSILLRGGRLDLVGRDLVAQALHLHLGHQVTGGRGREDNLLVRNKTQDGV